MWPTRLSRKKTRVLIQRDVAKVKQYAAVVLEFTPYGVKETRNENPLLNVIAVIGPGEAFGEKFEEALLCEAGIGKSRPYRRAEIPEHQKIPGTPTTIAKRRKWCYLTEEQYTTVAPYLFKTLQKLTDERVKTWKSQTFDMGIERERYSVNQGFRVYKGRTSWPRGARFSASLQDRHLVADLYRTECDTPHTRARLTYLARYIDRLLNRYRKHDRRRNKPSSRKTECLPLLQRAKILLERRSLPYYLLRELFARHKPEKRNNDYLWHTLESIIKKEGGFALEKPHHAGEALPNTSTRINGCTLYVVSDWYPRKTTHDHIAFEVFPSETLETSEPIPF